MYYQVIAESRKNGLDGASFGDDFSNPVLSRKWKVKITGIEHDLLTRTGFPSASFSFQKTAFWFKKFFGLVRVLKQAL
ncbi:hypothetical protein Leryth_005675 [Lithospermum erythrorhizon]|nr:hypothetical protein Leryth_005675 [Lithospermum erythrorhizon]